MGTLLKTVAYTATNYPLVKRSQATLSDGNSVQMVVDMNQTGITGAGGDGTGVPKILFYTCPNTTVAAPVWTLRATITYPAATTARTIASMAVDLNNNIHVMFQAGDRSIRYCLLTYSGGPAFSVGSQVTALAIPGGGISYSRLDVDVLGTGSTSPVLAVFAFNGTTLTSYVISVVRTSGGSFVQHANVTLSPAGKSIAGGSPDITVACEKGAAGANTSFLVVATRKGVTSDLGDIAT